jgi:hypothetical protein
LSFGPFTDSQQSRDQARVTGWTHEENSGELKALEFVGLGECRVNRGPFPGIGVRVEPLEFEIRDQVLGRDVAMWRRPGIGRVRGCRSKMWRDLRHGFKCLDERSVEHGQFE